MTNKYKIGDRVKFVNGRYIKALVDNAQNSKIIKDKYYLIKKHIDTAITIDNGYQLNTQYQNKYYELMPIGFNPEQEIKPQFELGKWYKTEKYNCYIKIKSYNEDEVIGETVYSTRTYHGNDYFCNEDYINNLRLLTDLSEIQKFLPHGHVDKKEVKLIDNLVEGEIYYFRTAYEYIVRFKEIFNTSYNGIRGTDIIILNRNNTSLYRTTYVNSANSHKEIRLATLEEKKWLNVCTKANKFISKDNLHLYDDKTFELIKSNNNIPEYVKCIQSYFYEIEYIKGNIYKIINNCIGHERGTVIDSINGKQRFIPSTKEVYDKQQALLNGGIFEIDFINELPNNNNNQINRLQRVKPKLIEIKKLN